MRLIKIGGVIFKSPEAVKNLISYVNQNQDEKLYVVFSAFDNTSALLKQAINSASLGDYASALSNLNSIKNHHQKLALPILNNQNYNSFEQILDKNLENSIKLLKGISIIQDYSAKVADQILSLGEILVLEFINQLFKQENLDFAILPAQKWLIANDNFTNAEALKEASRAEFQSYYDKEKNHKIFVSEGFLARTEKNEICTMGFESSNKTVMLIAEFLEIDKISIISDVDGIYSADPKISLEAKQIERLSFDFAIRLAENGLKLLYKPLLEFCKLNKIEISYSTLKTNSKETLILHKAQDSDIAIFNDRAGIFSVTCKNYEEVTKIVQLLSGNAHNILLHINKVEFSTFSDISTINRLLKAYNFAYLENLTEITILGATKGYSFSKEYYKYLYDAKENQTIIWGLKSELLHSYVNYG